MRCDSHIHVVGPLDRFPRVANRSYVADVAPLADIGCVAAASISTARSAPAARSTSAAALGNVDLAERIMTEKPSAAV